jgi:hypothetical protein
MRALMIKTTTQQSTNVRRQRQRTTMAGKRQGTVVEVKTLNQAVLNWAVF